MDYRAWEMPGENHVAATSDNEERMLLQDLTVEQLPEVVEGVELNKAVGGGGDTESVVYHNVMKLEDITNVHVSTHTAVEIVPVEVGADRADG